MYDGKVVFEVDLDTKDFTKKIEQTKSELDGLMKQYDKTKKKPLYTERELEDVPKDLRGKLLEKASAKRKQELNELAMQIQDVANKYVDLKAKQDAVFKAEYKKSIASVKNINMMDNAAYNKSYALQYQSLGNSILKIKGDLPYVANGFKDIGAKAIDAGNNSIKAGQQAESSGKLFSKGFGDGLKSVKKLALGIIGIRSAYMLARRAASAYMSEDTELTEKMNKAWFNLGAFLEPFLSFVADAMLKLTGYLNEFIKALTGTDYLARANAKALKKQTKEQENLNSAMDKYQQYDFDVIRTQSSTGGGAGGTGGVSESGLGALGDVELNENLASAIRKLGQAYRDYIDLITFKDVREAAKEATEAAHIATGTAIDTNKTIGNVVDTLTKNPDNKTIDEMTASLDNFENSAETDINAFLRLIDNAEKKKDQITGYGLLEDWFFGAGKAEKNQIKYYKQSIQKIIYGLVDLGKQGKLTTEGAETLMNLMKNNQDLLIDVGDETKEYAFTLDDVTQALGTYAGQYPYLAAQMYGFKADTDSQQKQIGRLISSYQLGKISLKDFIAEMGKIPEKKNVKFTIDKLEEVARGLKSGILDQLNGIQAKYDTKIVVDDKEAEKKIGNVTLGLGGLANKVVNVALKATLDDSDVTWRLQNMRSKLENIPFVGATMSKLFSGIFGFASGGYVSQPTLAWVGEGKSKGEYMIPDGEDYISRLASEIGQYGGGGTTNIYLDGRLIQRQVSKTANKVSFTRNGR